MVIIAAPLCHATFSDRGRQLKDECEKAWRLRKFNILKSKGAQLKRVGQNDNQEDERLYGEHYQLTAIIQLRDTTDITVRIDALQQKIEELDKKGDKSLAARLASTVSLYHHFVTSDFSQSSHYAFKNLELARQDNNEEEEIDALSRLASLYFSKQDASGWDYALEGYNKAIKAGNDAQIYVAASNLANYLFNQGKFSEALKYLNQASDMADKLHLDCERTYLNSFFGDIYANMGKPKKAEEYYMLSMKDDDVTNNYDKIYARICYSLFLYKQGRTQEALSTLLKTKELAAQYKVSIFDTQILFCVMNCYEKLGDYQQALKYSKLYTEAYQRVLTEEKERDFAILDLRNKVSEEKRKNADNELLLMKRTRFTLIICTALGLLLIVGVMMFINYRRKMAANRNTVRQYLENLEYEKNLRRKLEDALASRNQWQGKSSGLSLDKQSELFNSLEDLMEKEHIYRAIDLSLEKVAEMLSTNRTYLSQVVNEKARQSFPSYINSYRLKEAIMILSDPENEDSLKSIALSTGFATPSSFYTLFKQKTGMSPSAFREKVKVVQKDRQ